MISFKQRKALVVVVVEDVDEAEEDVEAEEEVAVLFAEAEQVKGAPRIHEYAIVLSAISSCPIAVPLLMRLSFPKRKARVFTPQPILKWQCFCLFWTSVWRVFCRLSHKYHYCIMHSYSLKCSAFKIS